jgi:hypothetical protein
MNFMGFTWAAMLYSNSEHKLSNQDEAQLRRITHITTTNH